jgi:hypothetical protein
MSGNPKKPGSKFRRRFVSVSGSINPQKNFLRQLFRNRMILYHPEQKMDHRGPMFFKELCETGPIAVLDPKHQLRIVVKSRRGSHTRVNPFRHRLVSVNCGGTRLIPS